jgi:hypothetical protein
LGGFTVLQLNAETLQMRIDRLKNQLAQCQSGIDVTDEIQHILDTAPQTLRHAENAIQTGNPALFEELNETLKRTEVAVTWATETIKGQATAQAIQEGRVADPGLEVHQRLLNRILKFMLTKVDGTTYLQMVKEFAGDDAVDGDTVYMDPTGETEAFSQWLMHDICLPGQPKRIIDLFAQEHAAGLPDDEKALLKLRQADRPSIYKVIDLSGDYGAPGIYLIQDILSPNESLRVWDVSSSKTLTNGAIFLGRAIPYDEKSDLYSLLGTITELPPKLWAILEPHIEQWKKDYFGQHPQATPDTFYRAYHARLQRKILEITEPVNPAAAFENIEVSANKKKIAADIHKFVMKKKKKGRPVESIMGSTKMLKYMQKFKRLMDTCSPQEMDWLTAKYEGFYDFALLLENFATAIRDGEIKVP